MDHGVEQRGMNAMLSIFHAIQKFDAFTPDNDPYGEHDFGAIEYDSQKLFWKIDYFDNSLEFGSPDPADQPLGRWSAFCRKRLETARHAPFAAQRTLRLSSILGGP